MSLFATYTAQQCTITRPGAPDHWGATVAGSRATVACRFATAQRQVTLADGTLALATALLQLDNVDIRVDDRVALVGDATAYRVLAVLESRALGATVARKTAFLA